MFTKGYNGQYLSTKKTQRPPANVIKIFDQFMDFENEEYKHISIKWNLRFFGQDFDLDGDEYKTWKFFAKKYQQHLDLQDKIYLPIIRIERKLFFEGKRYHNEVKVRDQKMVINWDSFEEFNESFVKIIECSLPTATCMTQ